MYRLLGYPKSIRVKCIACVFAYILFSGRIGMSWLEVLRRESAMSATAANSFESTIDSLSLTDRILK